MVQILPGVDQYIRPGIEKLGDTISLFTETDRRTQRAIRNMLIENPALIQQFADVEYTNPGSLKQMGFGSVSDLIAGVGPSLELQDEERFGQRELDLKGEELGLAEDQVGLTREEMDLRRKEIDLRETQIPVEERQAGIDQMKNIIVEGLMETSGLTEAQAEAAYANIMGVPTQTQLDREEDLDAVAELNAERARRMMQMLKDGEESEGPMWGLVARARAGQVSEMEINSILADPARREQYLMLWDLMGVREAAIDADLDNEPTKVWDLPVGIQEQYTNIAPARVSMGLYALKVNNYMKRAYGSRLMGRMRLSSDEQQRALGEIEAMKNALMGTLRPMISPGPLSKFDIDMLDKMLGNVLSIRPELVAGQLEGAMQFFEGKVRGLTITYPKVQVPRIPASEIPSSLIDLLKESGMTQQEARDYTYRMGYDTGGNRHTPPTETTTSRNTSVPGSGFLPPDVLENVGRYLQQFMQGDTTSGGGGR